MSDQKVIVFGVDGLIPELVYKFSSEGALPNISKLMKSGGTTELLPYISTWGDVNWVSFIAGQAPGTSWVGQNLPNKNGENLLGIMQKEGKKAALVHFPGTVSVENTEHYLFAPFFGGKGNTFEVSQPAIFSTTKSHWTEKVKKEALGWPPEGTLAHHEKRNISNIIAIDEAHYHFFINTVNGRKKEVLVEVINNNQLLLKFDNETEVYIESNNWSEWCLVPIDETLGYVRFKLLSLNLAAGELTILQSQITAIGRISNDGEIEEEIISKNGPFISKWTVKASPDEPYFETSFEEAEYQALWLAKTSLQLIEEKGFHLFATVFRLNDETHHTCLGKYDSESPFYDEAEVDKYEEVMKKAYEVLDHAIGYILDHKDENTTLILASDHGNVPNSYFCDIYKRLEEYGLVKLDSEGKPILSESKAFLKDERGGLEIFVNTKERNPFGIVDPLEYEKVQSQIYHSLSTWYHQTEKGQLNVVNLVLRKQDAAMIGYWGENMGDVIFTYNQGFVWGSNNKDIVGSVTSHGANHGPQSPSSKTRDSSNLGLFICQGKHVKSGYKRKTSHIGYYLMNDCGTTIAKIIGIQLKTLDGRVMADLMNE
ncbi:alkaline phosphatase family protein [Bacillus sp. JJ1521]|uniref:alkaline phosphatase family protein n=1 Tax=Bacillus sp. JJ1521 TaxID=3122957 RepID=UPI00300059E2